MADENRRLEPCLQHGTVQVLDDGVEPIRLALVRFAVAREVEGDDAPARIERLELRDSGAPGPAVEREPVQQDERRARIRADQLVRGEAGVL